jgi:hypothetical protein
MDDPTALRRAVNSRIYAWRPVRQGALGLDCPVRPASTGFCPGPPLSSRRSDFTQPRGSFDGRSAKHRVNESVPRSVEEDRGKKIEEALTGRALAPMLTSRVLGCAIATPLHVARREAHGTPPHGRGPAPNFTIQLVVGPAQRATCDRLHQPRFPRDTRRAELGYRLPGVRASASPAEVHSRSPVRSSSHITPEPPDSTRPHPVPPRVPYEVLRRSRRRERHAGVSCPHVHHETARNAQHACLMPRRALSIVLMRTCVLWYAFWRAKQHANALRGRWPHEVLVAPQGTGDESRSLRSLLLREPAGRIDR